MTAQKGSLLVIKAGNAGTPETFSIIGGLRVTQLTLNNQPMDSTHLESGVWRTLMTNAGARSLLLTGSGIFTDSASEEILRSSAFAGIMRNYELAFGNGDKVSGAFLLTQYERAGEVDGEETYTLSLESAGAITFTAG